MCKKIERMDLRGEVNHRDLSIHGKLSEPYQFVLGSNIIGAGIKLNNKIKLSDGTETKHIRILIFCVLRQTMNWEDSYYVSDIKIMKTPGNYGGKFEFESLEDPEIFEEIIEHLGRKDIEIYIPKA